MVYEVTFVEIWGTVFVLRHLVIAGIAGAFILCVAAVVVALAVHRRR